MCAGSSSMGKHAGNGLWLPEAAEVMGVVDPLVSMTRTMMHVVYSMDQSTAYRSGSHPLGLHT